MFRDTTSSTRSKICLTIVRLLILTHWAFSNSELLRVGRPRFFMSSRVSNCFSLIPGSQKFLFRKNGPWLNFNVFFVEVEGNQFRPRLEYLLFNSWQSRLSPNIDIICFQFARNISMISLFQDSTYHFTNTRWRKLKAVSTTSKWLTSSFGFPYVLREFFHKESYKLLL